MTIPGDVGRQRRRRRRSQSKSQPPKAPAKPAPVSAAAVIAEARAPSLDKKSPEAPMSAAEVARMKVTLRFLREHRHTLKLKVNAAEDLLLNGRREPTDRGLCRHLLSKLERSRVVAAAEKMAPAQATEFLAGIVRFAPEVPYLVEFLRSVKASAHPRQAAAALTQALERVDFAETSSAQMRDLLQLVVDVFPASELPVFVFSLLSEAAFRAAFDRSSEGLPISLGELLVPLRALHGSLVRRGGRRSEQRLSLEQVREGALLMLGASRESLDELSEMVRRQLLEAGADALGRVQGRASNQVLSESLLGLFRSLEFRDAALRSELVRALASALLRAGVEPAAMELLRAELATTGEAPGSDARWAQHWLSALTGQRVGELALERRRHPRRRRGHGRGPAADAARAPEAPESEAASSGDVSDADSAQVSNGAAVPEGERWQRAFHIPTQREVLVRFDDGSGAASGELRAHAELRRRVLLPGVAAVVVEALGSERPHLALAWQGPPLPRRLSSLRRDSAELVLAWCREAALLLGGLAAQGLALPDATLARFSADESDRLWLVDLWALRESPPSEALSTQLELAKQLCRELLGALEREVLTSAAASALAAAGCFSDLLSALSPR
ncbi:MAG TPA: hypothetical protein VFS67_35270 [Polyangiaceae bacterium]|nr:hypothetical protein [Polyangiaceae bacterium]